MTAKLTAKPADGDGRLYTVTARVLELDRGGEHRRTSLDAPDVHDAQGVGGSSPSRPTVVTSGNAGLLCVLGGVRNAAGSHSGSQTVFLRTDLIHALGLFTRIYT